ncbi:MAG: type II toxin-antitoxin system HicA family toxin [Patescibacteria group bacterium]
MTKIPRNVKGKELLRAMAKLGFHKIGSRGSHVRLTHADGRWTQGAVHPKPIPQGTLRVILRQAELTVDQLIEVL